MAKMGRFVAQLGQQGKLQGGDPLKSIAEAVRVRARDGQVRSRPPSPRVMRARRASRLRTGARSWRSTTGCSPAWRPPVVALNRALAVAQVEGAERGLALVEALADDERLRAYAWLPAARAPCSSAGSPNANAPRGVPELRLRGSPAFSTKLPLEVGGPGR
jgi:RNA polymerase sigma-70 factor (ECF subfamily)